MAHPKVTDLEALLESLAGAGLEFVVVGGVAAVLHGAPVTTLDLDIVPRQSVENIERLWGLLDRLDAQMRLSTGPVKRPTREMLVGKGQINLSTNLGPLDILCTLHSGEGYEELARSAVIKGDQVLEVKTIDLETLIRIKSSTGRIKDKMVVPLLMSLRSKKS
ncbi:MAG: hypothetical protein GY811_19250 [Myxococcales bacterium]|nr:hypothetical protein [Myxococcales bacterium]